MSMQKIARQTGVSYATISRAFNQPDKVRPETLRRIHKVCNELNYRPRVIPNNLATVTIIVPVYGQIEAADGILLANATSELNRHGMPTLVTTMQSLESRPSVFRKAFIGIPRNFSDDDLKLLRQFARHSPFVAINDMNDNIGPDAIRVGSDHPGAVNLALDHILSHGHRRIAFVCRQRARKGYTDRLEAFRKRLTQHGLFDESLVFCNSEQFLLDGLSRICAGKPTAMLVADAQITLKVLQILKVLGREVPRDLSMMTFEHVGGTEFLHPPITSVVQPIDAVGRAAADIMLQCLREPGKSVARSHTLPYSFIDRESVVHLHP